jgi:hypothetical protein
MRCSLKRLDTFGVCKIPLTLHSRASELESKLELKRLNSDSGVDVLAGVGVYSGVGVFKTSAVGVLSGV